MNYVEKILAKNKIFSCFKANFHCVRFYITIVFSSKSGSGWGVGGSGACGGLGGWGGGGGGGGFISVGASIRINVVVKVFTVCIDTGNTV